MKKVFKKDKGYISLEEKPDGVRITLYGLDESEYMRLGLTKDNKIYYYTDTWYLYSQTSSQHESVKILLKVLTLSSKPINLTDSEYNLMYQVLIMFINNYTFTKLVEAKYYILDNNILWAVSGDSKIKYDISEGLVPVDNDSPKILFKSPEGSPILGTLTKFR